MIFHDSMDRAVRYAATGPAPLDEKILTPPEVVNLAEQPDDYMLNINPEFFEFPADYITADITGKDQPDVLRPIFHAFNKVTGQKLSEEYINDMIEHEGQHWAAAQTLGATAARIVVQVSVSEVIDGKQIFAVQPFLRDEGYTTTKLGHAATIARPKLLSESDRMHLQEIGYPNIFELGQKIMAHNDKGEGPAYPLPLMLDQEKAKLIFG